MRTAPRSRPAVRLAAAVLAVSGVLAVVGAPRARAGDDAAPGAVAGVVFEKGPPPFADLLAKAKAEGKPIFIDFSTEWCGWCRCLERDTFAKPEVGEAMKAFVNVAFDAEQGEGVALACAASLRAKMKDGKFPAGLERLLARLHRTAAEQALARALADADDDPTALNEAAWTMYLMRGDTRKALAWARRAVELSKRDPAMLDTLACLLAETGAFDEAIALEEEALAAVQDESMRRDFVENGARWKAVREVRKAGGVGRSAAVPAAPVAAPDAVPAEGK